MPIEGQIKIASSSAKKEKGWIDICVDAPNKLANPFAIKNEEDRDKVIAVYKVWLWRKIRYHIETYGSLPKDLKEIIWKVYSLHNVRLICECAPKASHADVIKSCVEWLIPPKKLTLQWIKERGEKLNIKVERLESLQPRNAHESYKGCYKGRYSVDGWLCRNLEEVYSKMFNPKFNPDDFNFY